MSPRPSGSRPVAVGRALRRRTRAALEALAIAVDPTPVVARRRFAAPATGVLCCVYRRALGVGATRRLVEEALRSGLSVRLWALDEPVPELARWTVGAGAGDRPALLNALVAAGGSDDGWTVLADDDVRLRPGGLATLLAVARRAGFDLAQPGHGATSHLSHLFLRASPGVIARRTTFVEIGPVVAVAPRVHDVVFPLGEDVTMGVGEDVSWSLLEAHGVVTLGVVDAVRMRHLRPPTPHVARDETVRRELARRLGEFGVSSIRAIQTDRGSWPVTRGRPGWGDLLPDRHDRGSGSLAP